MNHERRNSLKAGLSVLAFGFAQSASVANSAAAGGGVSADRLVRAWRIRRHLISTADAARRHAARQPAVSENVPAAVGQAQIDRVEAEIVGGRAQTLGGLAVQASLLSEYCELGTRQDDGDLILAHKVAGALNNLAADHADLPLPRPRTYARGR